MALIRHALGMMAAALLASSLSQAALAEGLPPGVRKSAHDLKRSCHGSNGKTIKAIVSVRGSPEEGIVYILDGSRTPCGRRTPLCEAQGCPLLVYWSSGGGPKLLVDQNVYRWEATPDGARLEALIHADYCNGRSKFDYCVLTVDTKTGRQRLRRLDFTGGGWSQQAVNWIDRDDRQRSETSKPDQRVKSANTGPEQAKR